MVEVDNPSRGVLQYAPTKKIKSKYQAYSLYYLSSNTKP